MLIFVSKSSNKLAWGSGAAESFFASPFLSDDTLSEPLFELKLFLDKSSGDKLLFIILLFSLFDIKGELKLLLIFIFDLRF